MQFNDRENVLKALAGDRNAYGRLIDSYQGMVFAVALNITGNYSDSQDIVQEAFLIAYRKLRTLSDPSQFAKWLYTIAKRLALHFLKEKRLMSDSQEILVDQIESDGESASEAFAHKELSNILWSQVAELPPRTREAILLYYMEGFSVKRAAAFLGISENAMKARLHFGREKLHDTVIEKIEVELRQRRPSKKTSKAILAALPAGGVPKLGLLGTLATKGGLTMSAISAKKAAIIAAVIIVGTITTVTIINRPPEPSPVTPLQKTDNSVKEKSKTVRTYKTVYNAVPDTITTVDIIDTPTSEPEIRTAISGRVFYVNTENPVPGAKVTMYLGRENYRTVSADEAGYYEAVFPSAVTIAEIFARKDHFTSEKIMSLMVEENKRLQDIDLYLKERARISGRVIESRTKQPVADAKVYIGHGDVMYTWAAMNAGGASKGFFEHPGSMMVYTDTEGYFAITGLPPGTYEFNVELSSRPWLSVGSLYISPITLKPGENRDDIIIEIPTARIYGTVKDIDGNPAPEGTEVALMKYYGLATARTKFTYASTVGDTAGYMFESCGTKGNYKYKISVDVPERGHASKYFTIPEDKSEIEVNLVLSPGSSDVQPGAVVSGFVTDENGQPIEGCWVRLYLLKACREYGKRTDSEGAYRFEGLWVGKYLISFFAAGGYQQSSDRLRIRDGVVKDQYGEGIINFNKVLKHAEKIVVTAKLVFADGSPVSGQEVVLEGTGYTTDENGIIEKAEISTKNSLIRIEFDGAEYYFRKKIEERQKTVTFTIEKPGAIEGKVLKVPYYTPIQKFSIKATRAGHSHLNKSFSSETGEFYIDALQPGKYSLHISTISDSPALTKTISDIVVEPDLTTDNVRVILGE